MNFNNFVIFSSLEKIHLETFKFFFFTRLRWEDCAARLCISVCGGFNEKKIALTYQPRRQLGRLEILLSKKTYYKTTLSLTILTKHIVGLRCRCSCKIGSTSAVPLLVISETVAFLS